MKYGICYIWSDCHEMKSKHIDWTQGLKCDHRGWPWPWHWPWIFKVKYWICYISVKNGPIATKRKANISIELQTSNVTNGFDLGHDLDLIIILDNSFWKSSRPENRMVSSISTGWILVSIITALVWDGTSHMTAALSSMWSTQHSRDQKGV